MLSGKVISIHLIAGLIKKTWLFKMSYFPEPHSNKQKTYATKFYLKNVTDVRYIIFWYEGWFTSLKSDADKLDINKLVNVPIGGNSLKSAVDNLDANKKAVSIDAKI